MVKRTEDSVLELITDRQGMHHLYSWAEGDTAAFSTSPLLLGVVAGESLDLMAIGKYALVGNYLGSETLVRNVEKIPACGSVLISDGKLRMSKYSAAARDELDGSIRPKHFPKNGSER